MKATDQRTTITKQTVFNSLLVTPKTRVDVASNTIQPSEALQAHKHCKKSTFYVALWTQVKELKSIDLTCP